MFDELACCLSAALLTLAASALRAQSWVYITDTPDYDWHAGCFGTGTGNLFGYWDRNGLPNFYTGPTGEGLAPLNSYGANVGIRSMWASKSGFDGRPSNQPGHIDDYYSSGNGSVYDQSIAADPYVLDGRAEHPPDCIGDFIGLNQRKWTNALMNGECIGNIDAYSFVYWDTNGQRRMNYAQTNVSGTVLTDIQSDLKDWSHYRNYDADVFTQLNDHRVGGGRGFTYDNLKTEINAGYPVLFFLQPENETYRTFGTANRYNPEIHGIMAYGYIENVAEVGANKGVLVRTSWGSGDNSIVEWGASWLLLWLARGAIGYHPKPKITTITRSGNEITITWDGPSSHVYDKFADTTTPVHRYQLERATTLSPPDFSPVGPPTTERFTTTTASDSAFYRVVLFAN